MGGMSTDEWLKSGSYLPAPLRDFHDSKDVFKTMHTLIAIEKNDYAKSVSWVTGQCYVIDVFLWLMARRGWTMQRSRAKVEFNHLGVEIEAVKRHEAAEFKRLLGERIPAQPATPLPHP